MFSHRSHRYSQIFLSNKKSVLIRVICGRIPFKQNMNILPQISQIFTDVLELTKICVNPRNLWENTFQAGYECSPADLTDIHRYS